MQISIITINYNNINGLKKTIDSIVNQTWRDFEWIIIDGGSTDGSKELIEEVAKDEKNNVSYWCSEPDKGIYNAMNKGIDKGNGEWLNFMNSGDGYCNEYVLDRLFKSNPTADLLVGNMIYQFSPKQRRMQCVSLGKAQLSGWDILYTSIPHHATFFKRFFFDNGVRYDEKYRIWSDLNLFFHLYYNLGATVSYYNNLDIADFDVTGISQNGNELIPIEREQIRKSYYSEKEYEFYKESFNNIDLRIIHNINSLNWMISLFYYIAKFLGYKQKQVDIVPAKLSAKILKRDIDFYIKNETIRQSRILYRILKLFIDTIFSIKLKSLPKVE